MKNDKPARENQAPFHSITYGLIRQEPKRPLWKSVPRDPMPERRTIEGLNFESFLDKVRRTFANKDGWQSG